MQKPRTLRLTIKKKWFDMIRSGEKTEEYREIKPYWFTRLFLSAGNDLRLLDYWCKRLNSGDTWEFLCSLPNNPKYQKVEFVNGYKPDSPKVMLECLSISVRKGKPEWGAEPDKLYFVIKLGKIINEIIEE